MQDKYDLLRIRLKHLEQFKPPENQYVKFPIGGKRPQCHVCGKYAKRIEPREAEWAEWDCNCWRLF